VLPHAKPFLAPTYLAEKKKHPGKGCMHELLYHATGQPQELHCSKSCNLACCNKAYPFFPGGFTCGYMPKTMVMVSPHHYHGLQAEGTNKLNACTSHAPHTAQGTAAAAALQQLAGLLPMSCSCTPL
jgi:hypothetical protein